ncbi:MAG: sigma-54-dependent Fis family transcriptional regulator [Calditrichaeota bacterium]|nr:sigma-54-dependent Fis family transcriptional regulator [Calditrichota bacterium]MCB0304292.1 sigma-54-dependent Fis family transcriptional regulator [Calditrichota bacterium]
MPAILIVDNEEKFCKVIQASLALESLQADYCTSGEDALAYLEARPVDALVSDLRMDGISGLELLEAVKERYPETEVIIMTAYATQKTAVEALKKGAYDYLIKPFEMDELTLRLRRIFDQKRIVAENKRLRQGQEAPIFFRKIVGRSQKMQEIYRLIKKGSENEATVLVRGESGTGKELVAEAIHGESDRAKQPFVAVNCAALPENLLESELFGYEKGAFTGATQRRLGKFEQAHEGSIFLDEIGDMSLATQAKLLRVLQNREIYRLGGNEQIIVDVRIIAATHQDLEAMVESGQFRNDLYYRLNVFPITLPPLRERKEDIPALAHHFVEQSSARGIDRRALAYLMDYDWPGNVRELQNAIERAAIICEEIIEVGDLPATVRREKGSSAGAAAYEIPPEGIRLDEFEKDLIVQAIQKAAGNKTRAAELLGITRRRLYSMMERFGIDPNR